MADKDGAAIAVCMQLFLRPPKEGRKEGLYKGLECFTFCHPPLTSETAQQSPSTTTTTTTTITTTSLAAATTTSIKK